MHRFLRLSVITLAFASLAAVATAQPVEPVGKNGDVQLTQPATVGSTVLKPGHYRFKHATQDGRNYLVVSRQETRRSGGTHYASGGGTEVARVLCEMVPLDAKATETRLYMSTQPDGSRTITQIRIRGEGAGHLVALEPKP